MGAASSQFEELRVSRSGVSTVNDLALNIKRNSEKLMMKLRTTIDLFDQDKEIENITDNNLQEIKENIEKKVIEKIKIYYTDELMKKYSIDTLQKINKYLNYGLELDQDEYKFRKEETQEKLKKSTKSQIQESRLGKTTLGKYLLGESKEFPQDITAAKKQYAENIVSIFVEKYYFVYGLNKFFTKSQQGENRSMPDEQPNEYLRDYVNIYNSRFNLEGKFPTDIDNEIEYRYRNVSDSLKTVYKDINQNLKEMNKASDKKEVEKVKKQYESPSKNVKNLCNALDQACPIIGLSEKTDVGEIRNKLNKNLRKVKENSICRLDDKNFNLKAFQSGKLRSPCEKMQQVELNPSLRSQNEPIFTIEETPEQRTTLIYENPPENPPPTGTVRQYKVIQQQADIPSTISSTEKKSLI
jgi:hypothetical protein